jgi:xanthine dehydrogenase YagS FAD-binding subunit
MRNFDYMSTTTVDAALTAISSGRGARFLAGGTTLLDLMKCGVEEPSTVIDITRIDGLDNIEIRPESIRIGALAKMAEVAGHPMMREDFPVLSESLWRGASEQLRNMATIGGNLLQRTRCSYFREPRIYSACNKRRPGSGCAALKRHNRGHAILGTSEHCIATYPGYFAVALMAFDAEVHVENGQHRTIAIEDFFPLPNVTPQIEHPIAVTDLIVAVEIPVTPALRCSHYLKVRDRESYEFAAASAAVGLELETDGITIRDVRIALGGVATTPWRARAVEAALVGKPFEAALIREASFLAVEDAVAYEDNRFKIDLVPRVIARALLTLGEEYASA